MQIQGWCLNQLLQCPPSPTGLPAGQLAPWGVLITLNNRNTTNQSPSFPPSLGHATEHPFNHVLIKLPFSFSSFYVRSTWAALIFPPPPSLPKRKFQCSVLAWMALSTATDTSIFWIAEKVLPRGWDGSRWWQSSAQDWRRQLKSTQIIHFPFKTSFLVQATSSL